MSSTTENSLILRNRKAITSQIKDELHMINDEIQVETARRADENYGLVEIHS